MPPPPCLVGIGLTDLPEIGGACATGLNIQSGPLLVVLRPRPYVFNSSPPSYYGWIFLFYWLTQSNWRPVPWLWQSSCSRHAVVMQLSCSRHAVVMQSSSSRQVVDRQLAGSQQTVGRQATCSHQAVSRQSADSHQADFKIGCHCFSVVLLIWFFQNFVTLTKCSDLV